MLAFEFFQVTDGWSLEDDIYFQDICDLLNESSPVDEKSAQSVTGIALFAKIHPRTNFCYGVEIF